MADALAALDEMGAQTAALARAASSGRTKNLSVVEAQPVATAIAKIYFGSIRTDIDVVKSRAGLVDEIDFVVQALLELASHPSEKLAYLGQLNELRPLFLEATVDLMKYRGTATLVLSQTERSILDTMGALLPHCAASYEQALRDISQGGRVSWRGTATELRETLREIMDHFAPDDKVSASPGFQLERNQTRPTQKQKVKFILKARRSSDAAVSVAQASLEIVEEAVATLARSTYQRGSISTHVATSGKEIKNLKRYVDALLAELLEIT
jgi:hypothetical protein